CDRPARALTPDVGGRTGHRARPPTPGGGRHSRSARIEQQGEPCSTTAGDASPHSPPRPCLVTPQPRPYRRTRDSGSAAVVKISGTQVHGPGGGPVTEGLPPHRTGGRAPTPCPPVPCPAPGPCAAPTGAAPRRGGCNDAPCTSPQGPPTSPGHHPAGGAGRPARRAGSTGC